MLFLTVIVDKNWLANLLRLPAVSWRPWRVIWLHWRWGWPTGTEKDMKTFWIFCKNYDDMYLAVPGSKARSARVWRYNPYYARRTQVRNPTKGEARRVIVMLFFSLYCHLKSFYARHGTKLHVFVPCPVQFCLHVFCFCPFNSIFSFPRVNVAAAVNVLNTTSKYFLFILLLFI